MAICRFVFDLYYILEKFNYWFLKIFNKRKLDGLTWDEYCDKYNIVDSDYFKIM